MRHRNTLKKFGRHAESRNALMRSLAAALIISGSIETTLPKAKYLRPYIEKLITRAKTSTLHNRRILISILRDQGLVSKLLEEVGPQFKDRNGGYTRIRRTRVREGDTAQMASISFVVDAPVIAEPKEEVKPVKKPRAKKSESVKTEK